MVRASPSLFCKPGLLCRYSVNDRIRLFKRNFGFDSVSIRRFVEYILSLRRRRRRRRRRDTIVFTDVSRLVAPNPIIIN